MKESDMERALEGPVSLNELAKAKVGRMSARADAYPGEAELPQGQAGDLPIPGGWALYTVPSASEGTTSE